MVKTSNNHHHKPTVADPSRELPSETWTRKLDAPEPSRSIHTSSTPPFLETLGLIPLAMRLGNHIASERKEGREPVFDLEGLTMRPPNPGPYGGVPCGGVGSGAIGRGYRGDFRRWSLHPGRYIHRVVDADVFCVRVQRGGLTYSQVLSILPFEKRSCLSFWRSRKNNFPPLKPSQVTYHAVFPRSWTVYEEPVPGLRVTVTQISPFLPHSYSEASLPAVVFHVDVENIGDDEADVSVMFSFQNGDGGTGDGTGGNIHVPFQSDAIDDTDNMPSSSFSEKSHIASTDTNILGHSSNIQKNGSNSFQSVSNSRRQVVGVGMSQTHLTVVNEKTKISKPTSPVNRPKMTDNVTEMGQQHNQSENVGTSGVRKSPQKISMQQRERLDQRLRTESARSKQQSARSMEGSVDMDAPQLYDGNSNILSVKTKTQGDTLCTRKVYFDQVSFAIACITSVVPASAAVSPNSPVSPVSPLPSTAKPTDTKVNDGKESPTKNQAKHRASLTYTRDEITFCSQYVSEVMSNDSVLEETLLGFDIRNFEKASTSAVELWNNFHMYGQIIDFGQLVIPPVSSPGTKTAAAVCLRKIIPPKQVKNFPFSLAWDCPAARFGFGNSVPRYYTRFFGRSGFKAPDIATYALMYEPDWTQRIIDWQRATLAKATQPAPPSRVPSRAQSRAHSEDKSRSHSPVRTNDSHAAFAAETIAALSSQKLSSSPSASSSVPSVPVQQSEGQTPVPPVYGPQQEPHPSAETKPEAMRLPHYYQHQLFNELYFLVDGGSVWADSENGVANDPRLTSLQYNDIGVAVSQPDGGLHQRIGNFIAIVYKLRVELETNIQATIRNKDIIRDLMEIPSKLIKQTLNLVNLSDSRKPSKDMRVPRTSKSEDDLDSLEWFRPDIECIVGVEALKDLRKVMLHHDTVASDSAGNQAVVGQFLYLESHEYYMYNTYDVHFYAGFALLMNFPQLELSLQRDFATAVNMEDMTMRSLVYDGKQYPRKVKGCVPHDLGAPSQCPYDFLNAYNFQDVSNWKDLGPKFVLQIYRNYCFMKQRDGHRNATTSPTTLSPSSTADSNNQHQQHQSSSTYTPQCIRFLRDIYPVLVAVMRHAEMYDKDDDGMIENTGFPDQTYDIWVANGIHAYCGGLWLTACSAMRAMGKLMKDQPTKHHYQEVLEKGKKSYISSLWNGFYLNYDSSSSGHHNSIMADMLAGHWFSRACNLTPVLTQEQVLSCMRIIYEYNVVKFGGRKLLGAVNGMRPNGTVDSCCMQSREVWTGTTYGLAAVMMHESIHYQTKDANTAIEAKLGMSKHMTESAFKTGLRVDSTDSICSHVGEDGTTTQSVAWSPQLTDRSSPPPSPTRLAFISTTTTTATGTATTQVTQHHSNSSASGDTSANGTDINSPGEHTVSVTSTAHATISSITHTTTIESEHTEASNPSATILQSPINPLKNILNKNRRTSEIYHVSLIDELRTMSFNTAQGIHDSGWRDFGYWFATPEAWESNGNYRSLGYMRALAIWGIQYAVEHKDKTA